MSRVGWRFFALGHDIPIFVLMIVQVVADGETIAPNEFLLSVMVA